MAVLRKKGGQIFPEMSPPAGAARHMHEVAKSSPLRGTKEQYTGGTVPSFYRFRSITLKPIYDATFS